jgi:hypothetical protein
MAIKLENQKKKKKKKKETHRIGTGIWRETHKNVKNDTYTH